MALEATKTRKQKNKEKMKMKMKTKTKKKTKITGNGNGSSAIGGGKARSSSPIDAFDAIDSLKELCASNSHQQDVLIKTIKSQQREIARRERDTHIMIKKLEKLRREDQKGGERVMP